jgi:ubiquinone/menaquinone biosynthesis C-methylase UbiE
MRHVSDRMKVAADRRTVWDYVTNPANFPDYVAGYSAGEVLSENATGDGARYAWTGSFGPIRLSCTERVVEWEPDQRVAYEGELAGIRFRSAMELERAEGGSELRVDIGFEPKHAVVDPLIARLVRHDIERSLESVRRRFELPGAPQRIAELYRRRAASYDVATELYRLVGFPLGRFRQRAVDSLRLQPGDTVVEIGCGTGANFSRIEQRIGPSGRLIGVDLTDAMLERARARVEREGWTNVELVHSNAEEFQFPEGVDGILSTLALTLVPGYAEVIARGARALAPRGRWVVADLKEPDGWPRWAVELGIALCKPYGVTLEFAARHPWEALQRELPDTRVDELFFGAAYVATGQRAG